MKSWAVHFGSAVIAIAAALIATGASAAGGDPDWPCQQRLVPELTVGTYWNGPAMPENVDWRADSKIAELVAAAASRDVPAGQSEARLAAFADSLSPEQRKTLLPELFAGLVEAINQQRHDVIVRLKELSRRQKSISNLVDKVTDELRNAPSASDTANAGQRDEIEQRRSFLIQTFQQTQRTIQYACQVPTDLEARLGSYARALQAKL
jgi:hypothetical protein